MTGYIDVGGGMRAVYGAGVLDCCLDDGLEFPYYIGVSAGSANIISYLGGHKERTLRFYRDYSSRREYMSFYNLVRNKSYIGLDYIYKLKGLDWDVFANPMSTNTYTKKELEDLIREVNLIKPYGLSIVDTLGNMYEQDVVNIFEFIDKFLDKKIAIGFHSHNSMQLSFSNTKALLKMNLDRILIIDSCLYGMGRGAGNLCSELIIKYIKKNDEKIEEET